MNTLIPFLLSIGALIINFSLLAKFIFAGNTLYTVLTLLFLVFSIYLIVETFLMVSDKNSIEKPIGIKKKKKEKILSEDDIVPFKDVVAPIDPKTFGELAKEIAKNSADLDFNLEEDLNLISENEPEETFIFRKPNIEIDLANEQNGKPINHFKYITFKELNTTSALEALDNIVTHLGPAQGKSRLVISDLPLTRGFTLQDFIHGIALENQILCMGVAEKTSFIPHTGRLAASSIQPIIQYLWAKKEDFDEVIFYCKENQESTIKPIVDILNQRSSYEQTMQANLALAEELSL